jgi:hypothetical protein
VEGYRLVGVSSYYSNTSLQYSFPLISHPSFKVSQKAQHGGSLKTNRHRK